MKGPIIFFVTLALTAAVGVAVVLPARATRSRAVERLLEAPVAGEPDHAAEQRLRQGADRLATALGLRDDEGATSGVSRRLKALAEQFEVTPERAPEADRVMFRLPWEKLPGFLTKLSEFAGPVLAGVLVEPTSENAACRVQVRFALPGAPPDDG